MQAAAGAGPGNYKLPLVVAVTGHRNLVASELDQISRVVRDFLLELQQSYPQNDVVVMSPLAEGADMLVARVAVENRFSLIVPLPKPREEYLLDFSSDQARQEFETLCARAIDVFEVKTSLPPPPEGVDYEKFSKDIPYARLGAYLSAHCHILLAVWDGQPSAHLGGTAQVVKFHHDDIMPGLTPVTLASQKMLVDDESDLVYHVKCSRSTSVQESTNFKVDAWWYTKDQSNPISRELPAQHRLIFQRSATFSDDAQRHWKRIENEGFNLAMGDSSGELPKGIETIDSLFRSADWLAMHYQRRILSTLMLTHVMAYCMGLMFILYSDFRSERWFLLAFLAFFAVATASQLISRRHDWKRKYLDYRTLAEGLRVQFYWAAAGVMNENKWKFTHDSFLQSQNPEFGWIRNVMRVAGYRCDAEPNREPSGIEFAIREWVGAPDHGQLGYFKRKARDRIVRYELTEKIGQASLMVSALSVVLFLLLDARMPDGAGVGLKLLMGATLLLYAVREGYSYATATKELIKQYEYMLRIFDSSHRRLTQASSLEEKRLILLALGQSALDEHSDWILMHRERSMDESEIWRMGS